MNRHRPVTYKVNKDFASAPTLVRNGWTGLYRGASTTTDSSGGLLHPPAFSLPNLQPHQTATAAPLHKETTAVPSARPVTSAARHAAAADIREDFVYSKPPVPYATYEDQFQRKENFEMTVAQTVKTAATSGLDMKYTAKQYSNLSNPAVAGPPLWFVLHNASAKYPEQPSPLFQQRMMNVILAIPVLLTCSDCMDHATAYIESIRDQLPEITKSRDNLFRFFVDFHNKVNKRLGKREYSYEEAWKMYNGDAVVSTFSYRSNE